MEIYVDVLMRIRDISRGLGRWERKKLKPKKSKNPKMKILASSLTFVRKQAGLPTRVETASMESLFIVLEITTHSNGFEDGPSVPKIHGPFLSQLDAQIHAAHLLHEESKNVPGFCWCDEDEDFNPLHRTMMDDDSRVDWFVQPFSFVSQEEGSTK